MAIKKALVLDLESKPNEIYPLWVPRGDSDFQPPIFHEVVCASYALLDDKFKVEKVGLLESRGDEESLLRELVSLIDSETLVITWSGRRFDMPVITYRCMKYGIQTPWDKESDFRNRFRVSGHFDVQDHMMHHGASDKIKLDHAAALIGLPGKLDTVGADVPNLVARNRHDEVGVYCITDVIQTLVVFLRYSYVMGLASADEVNGSLESIKRLSRRPIEAADPAYVPDRTAVLVRSAVLKVTRSCEWSDLYIREE